MGLERAFDAAFATRLALREKQIQQNYRPLIGIHKWFARRPGTLFRNLLLSEFSGPDPLGAAYWQSHELRGVIADPFMGGGTTAFEANRLGFSVLGADINPMACWIVRQALAAFDPAKFQDQAAQVIEACSKVTADLYMTSCVTCGAAAPVKYWLWIKAEACPSCGTSNDLVPGHLVAEAVRHPRHVVVCGDCGELNECLSVPTEADPGRCTACGGALHIEGRARRQRISCTRCSTEFAYPSPGRDGPPSHRMWAIEYQCVHCRKKREGEVLGRQFKKPDSEDLRRYSDAAVRWEGATGLDVPDDEIPAGDETDRLIRWGYRRYRDMFNERQLLGLGVLLRQIRRVSDTEVRFALLTVFSDFLRYQNMLCRYDTYALKIQDIFSVHGFPVGLVQCENNLLGIPHVGSGSFRHFVEKYLRAKEYCVSPFETRVSDGSKKKSVPIVGEKIEATLVETFPAADRREALLVSRSADEVQLPPQSLDGVFTDPPYFDNVQYAELIDFCYVWLRLALADFSSWFSSRSTRSEKELTGNATRGRDLAHFTRGLSSVFRHYADALKPGAPFVFTYHHNDVEAYVPVVVAVLDSGLACTAALPAAAEMAASLHIAGTDSSVLDTVFVCRHGAPDSEPAIALALATDAEQMLRAGVRLTEGDLRCLAAGHVARAAINDLRQCWDPTVDVRERMERARARLRAIQDQLSLDKVVRDLAAFEGRERTSAHAPASV